MPRLPAEPAESFTQKCLRSRRAHPPVLARRLRAAAAAAAPAVNLAAARSKRCTLCARRQSRHIARAARTERADQHPGAGRPRRGLRGQREVSARSSTRAIGRGEPGSSSSTVPRKASSPHDRQTIGPRGESADVLGIELLAAEAAGHGRAMSTVLVTGGFRLHRRATRSCSSSPPATRPHDGAQPWTRSRRARDAQAGRRRARRCASPSSPPISSATTAGPRPWRLRLRPARGLAVSREHPEARGRAHRPRTRGRPARAPRGARRRGQARGPDLVVRRHRLRPRGTGRALRRDQLDDPDGGDVRPYAKSKTLAERAAWDFIAKEGGALELAVVNPVGVFGPVLGADYSTSILIVQRLMDGAMPGCRALLRRRRRARRRRSAPARDDQSRGQGRALPRGRRRLSVDAGHREDPEGAPGRRGGKVPTRRAAQLARAHRGAARSGGQAEPSRARQAQERDQRKGAAPLGWAPRTNEDAVVATAESLVRLGLLKHSAKPSAARKHVLTAGAPGAWRIKKVTCKSPCKEPILPIRMVSRDPAEIAAEQLHAHAPARPPHAGEEYLN